MADFMAELRKELERLNGLNETLAAQVATLTTQLTELRSEYQAHTHSYSPSSPGEGGSIWFDLAHLRHLLEDDDQTTWDNYGLYFRGSPVVGDAPEIRTGPPG